MGSIGARRTVRRWTKRASTILHGMVATWLLVVVASAGCSRERGDHPAPRTVAIEGGKVESKGLADAVAGLCLARQQALTDPGGAKATYEQRSRQGIEEATRALRPSYSIAASAVTEAAQAVEADIATDPPRPTLIADLSRLTEVTRQGLARLGIPTPPCER